MKPLAVDGKFNKRRSSNTSTLCVLPNDTLAASLRKGEVKVRYFNPSNMFSDIHVVSLTSHDIDSQEVQRMFGDANVVVHSIGPMSALGRLFCKLAPEFYYLAKLKQFLNIMRDIKPSVIRAYNPLLQGYIGAFIGNNLRVPTVISVHGNYDYDERYLLPKRILFWARRKPAKALFDALTFARLQTFGKLLERYSLKSASEVICAYQFPKSYVEKFRNTSISVIYNRVDTKRFKPHKRTGLHETTILHVARLDFEKNPENLIRAITGLRVKLLLVGNGELREYLKNLVSTLRMEQYVQFVPHYDHRLIHKLYAKTDIFVMCMKYGGVSIPILEAMASGLPIVFTRGVYESRKEVIDGIGVCVEDRPEDIGRALSLLLRNRRLRERLGRKAREKINRISGEKMERREAELYRKLMK